MSGQLPTVFRPAGIARQVAAAFAPPVWAASWALDDRTGTPTAGDTFPSVLQLLGQAANSTAQAATVAISAAGASYSSSGGVVCANGSAIYANVLPTGAALTDLQQRLDLAQYTAGEILMVWATMNTPAGWVAAHSGTNTLFCFGNYTSGSTSGAVDFSVSSVERPQVSVLGVGDTTGIGPIVPDAGFLIENALNAIVWEVRADGGGFFSVRVTINNGSGSATSAWSTSQNWAVPATGGTAAPGCGTFGCRLLRRIGTTSNQTNRDERVRQIGLARLPQLYEGVAARAAVELYARPAEIPPVLRTLKGDVTINYGPDGNADKTFGTVISEADMFVYLDGATPLADHPLMTIETEGGPNKSKGTSSPITGNPNYTADTSAFEGTLRASNTSERKFGRIKTGDKAGWFIFSGHKLDGGNRGRAEVKWTGTNVELQPGVEMWFAGLYYFDFMTDESQAGQLVINQLFPGPVPSSSVYGLYPPYSMTLDTTRERLTVNFEWASTTPTLPADTASQGYALAPYDAEGSLRSLLQRNVAIVIKHKWHWDATQGPRCQIWIDGQLLLDRQAPYGYRGPKGGTDAKTTNCYFQLGCYPPSPYNTPNTKRDVYIKRAFACKNAGNYTEAQIRAALTA